MRNKNHVTISIEAEEALDKIQHPFMIETLEKMGMEGKYLNRMKATHGKPTAQPHTQRRKTESHSSENVNKTRMPALTTLIRHTPGSLSQIDEARKGNKRDPSRTGRSETLTIGG